MNSVLHSLPNIIFPLVCCCVVMCLETYQHNLMLCQMSLIKEAQYGGGIIDIQSMSLANSPHNIIQWTNTSNKPYFMDHGNILKQILFLWDVSLKY